MLQDHPADDEIERFARLRRVFHRADQIAELCGATTAEEAFDRARSGDAVAAAGIAQIGRYLGVGIANMIVAVTPDRVVIGGGVAAILSR